MKKNSRDLFNKKEINLLELAQYFFERRKIFYWSILLMLFLGFFRYYSAPTMYEAVASRITEEDSRNQLGMGQLGSLAGLTGFNFPSGNSTSSISPEMYPEILKSKSFLVNLIHEKFYFETVKDTLSIEEYLVEDYKSRPFNVIFGAITGFPSKIASLFSSSEKTGNPIVKSDENEEGEPKFMRITSEEDLASELLKGLIKVENEGAIVTLSVKMPEALIAIELNNIIFEEIVKYVTEYKTRKLRINLSFVEERAKEAENNFIKTQMALASFRDQNQGIISQRAKTREEQLQAEFNIAFNLYNSMMQEEETSRIQLKKETPIFSEFSSPIVPNNPIGSSLWKTVIIFSFLGIILGFGIVIFMMVKEYFTPFPMKPE